ncbi:19523_t:CDS:2 [Funneliformis geosporum]|uniref:19523_t:CDS:1 n=1 Tax=Funneliformis geosporum TaxID=1117311 RepID=A0A9W4T347_9GLOM|nr:19523_t:CDS:2 [Funneliformis geosporum]
MALFFGQIWIKKPVLSQLWRSNNNERKYQSNHLNNQCLGVIISCHQYCFTIRSENENKSHEFTEKIKKLFKGDDDEQPPSDEEKAPPKENFLRDP